MDAAERDRLPTLPDLLRPGLDLVFVGINPGERSAERGHYYGHPGNAFWRRLSASPLVTPPAEGVLTCEDDASLLDHGIGFTDIVKRVITDSTQVTPDEFTTALPAFLERIALASPRAVCFTATRPFEAVFPGTWRSRGWGLQPMRLSAPGASRDAEVWVMPSPSGRAAAYHAQIDAVLADLARSLHGASGAGQRTQPAQRKQAE